MTARQLRMALWMTLLTIAIVYVAYLLLGASGILDRMTLGG